MKICIVNYPCTKPSSEQVGKKPKAQSRCCQILEVFSDPSQLSLSSHSSYTLACISPLPLKHFIILIHIYSVRERTGQGIRKDLGLNPNNDSTFVTLTKSFYPSKHQVPHLSNGANTRRKAEQYSRMNTRVDIRRDLSSNPTSDT